MSVTPLAISIEVDAPPEMLGGIEALLADESATHLGYPLRVQQFCAALRNENGGFEGGIYARAYWEWMRIDMLAVAPEWRGRGYGRMLLLRAEEWALSCACHDAWLMTMGEDAQRFWKREGYRVFAELPNFPGTLTRFFMKKSLGPDISSARDDQR